MGCVRGEGEGGRMREGGEEEGKGRGGGEAECSWRHTH